MVILFISIVLLFLFFSNPSGCVATLLFFVLFIGSFLTPFWPLTLGLLVLYFIVHGIFDKN